MRTFRMMARRSSSARAGRDVRPSPPGLRSGAAPGCGRRIGGPAAGPRTHDDCEELAGRGKVPMRRPAAELQACPIAPVGGLVGPPNVDVLNPGADGVPRGG